MTLTYWVAECVGDSPAYSLRYKTRRECNAARAERPGDFGPVHKITVEYSDAFDLLTQCLSEGSIYEGDTAAHDSALAELRTSDTLRLHQS